MRILFVDDDEPFLAATKELLEQGGYEVTACSSERQALDVIRARPEDFDIALFDMLLDRSRDAGLRLTRELIAHNPRIPIVVLTGYANFENAAECMEAGAFSYIRKEHTELLTPTLQRAIRRAVALAEDKQRNLKDAQEIAEQTAATRKRMAEICARWKSDLDELEAMLEGLDQRAQWLARRGADQGAGARREDVHGPG